MTELPIRFPFQARLFCSQPVTPATTDVWFVLHGYGQLAPYFIRKFEPVFSASRSVIAPEGLSRFYHEDVHQRAGGLTGRTGASWMTREARETDIQNYLNYLRAVYHEVIPADYPGTISILGFSQGAATACRWALAQPSSFHRLILWAGIFPEDINFDHGHAVLSQKKVVMVHGAADPFITTERLRQSNELIARLQIAPDIIAFPGGHEIDAAVLKNLI